MSNIIAKGFVLIISFPWCIVGYSSYMIVKYIKT